MDLEGLITPTNLHYTVQHFAVPPVVETDTWELKIVGEVKVRGCRARDGAPEKQSRAGHVSAVFRVRESSRR